MIPKRAIEAATLKLVQLKDDSGGLLTNYEWARVILAAAAPHMQAGAWGDGLQYAYEEGYLARPQLEALQESNPHRRPQ